MITDGEMQHRDNPFIELYHQDLKLLDNVFAADWADWVSSAPDDWKADGFLTSHRPISVCCRYGQNQAIARHTTMETDRLAWQQERDYQKIRTMFVATASHLRYVAQQNDTYNEILTQCESVKKVSKWQNIDPEEIEAEHKAIYDSPHRDGRKVIRHLEDLPMVDGESNSEVPIFSEDGRRIPRRTPLFSRGRKPCGLLVALQKIHRFFEHQHDPIYVYDSDEDGFDGVHQTAPNVSMYPQAYLHKYGHIQAKGIPGPLHAMLLGINQSVAKQVMLEASPRPLDSDSDDDEDAYVQHPSGQYRHAVQGVATQIYNSSLHCARPKASQHDAQLGDITAAFAGSHATGVAQRRTASQKLKRCNDQLPHERYALRMANENIPTDLRLEYITKIDMNSLKDCNRNGA